jgi:hypothetical protein
MRSNLPAILEIARPDAVDTIAVRTGGDARAVPCRVETAAF